MILSKQLEILHNLRYPLWYDFCFFRKTFFQSRNFKIDEKHFLPWNLSLLSFECLCLYFLSTVYFLEKKVCILSIFSEIWHVIQKYLGWIKICDRRNYRTVDWDYVTNNSILLSLRKHIKHIIIIIIVITIIIIIVIIIIISLIFSVLAVNMSNLNGSRYEKLRL